MIAFMKFVPPPIKKNTPYKVTTPHDTTTDSQGTTTPHDTTATSYQSPTACKTGKKSMILFEKEN